MGAIKIGSTTVITSSRNLDNIGSSSGELSLSGDSLTLKIGGTTQDSQSLQGLTVDEAKKLTFSRSISLSGDLSGSTSFDGSGNVTILATLDGVNVGDGFYALKGFGKCISNGPQCLGSGVYLGANAYPYCCECDTGNVFSSSGFTICTM